MDAAKAARKAGQLHHGTSVVHQLQQQAQLLHQQHGYERLPGPGGAAIRIAHRMHYRRQAEALLEPCLAAAASQASRQT